MEDAIYVEQLRLKFPGADELLFRDFSIRVGKGQKVLLLGPSGCGKSTLLQVLAGLIPGSIDIPLKYAGIRVPDSWGYVFQDPDTQFCMPFVDEEMAFVLENMCVSREQMPGMMTSLLRQVGLGFADMHTPIASLSQGMKQRLAIASVLALRPEALFLDEPTSLLDPDGTSQVWDAIKRVGQDKTVLIVEHKIGEVLDFVDRVILFNDNGEMIADGDPSGVFRANKEQLQEYGIWYPGVWDDYVHSERFRRMGGGAGSGLAEGLQGRSLASGLRAVEGPAVQEPGGWATGESGAAAHAGQPAAARPLMQLAAFRGFHGKQQKLEAASASVSSGEWIAVIGENGAGKSTLLQALMQLIPTSGGYMLAGRPVRGFRDVSGALGYVFQNPEFQFVTNSVFEEVAFTLRLTESSEAAVREQAEERLRQFGLAAYAAAHPFQLSLGQKRRLSVAAAIGSGQQALLLDEPTFGQDAQNTFAILEKLESLRRQGTAIVMVTHDMDIVNYFATTVWRVEAGKLSVEASSPAGGGSAAWHGERRESPDAAVIP
ncbi:ABC transporter ATP-binding protein [Paenibacillus thalictri]